MNKGNQQKQQTAQENNQAQTDKTPKASSAEKIQHSQQKLHQSDGTIENEAPGINEEAAP